VTVRLPDEKRPGDAGAIIEGKYAVVAGMLRVEDQRGREYTVPIRHGDDVETAARKLLRAKHATHGAFYDPIPLRPRGIV
jgi:hypothetical protein